MGGCYSTSSQNAALSPLHSRPRFRSSRRSRKKHYSPVNIVNIEDSHSQQDPEVSSIGKSVSFEEGTKGKRNSNPKQSGLEEEKGVAPSDSGIESLEFQKEELLINSDHVESGVPQNADLKDFVLVNREFTLCRACHRNLQRINQGLCEQCGQFRIDPSALSGLAYVKIGKETYCTCGPRQLGKASACRTHGRRVPAASGHSRQSGKESSHIVGTTVCVDGRGKEELGSSENAVFSCASPLHSSADRCLSKEGMGKQEECDGAFLVSKINDCCETLNFLCKCNHTSDPVAQPDLHDHTATAFDRGATHVRGSLLELLTTSPNRLYQAQLQVSDSYLCPSPQKKDDDDSGHDTTKNHTESILDLGLELELRTEGDYSDFSEQSSPLRLAAERALDTVSDETEGIVCRLTLGGQEMVMIDVATYICLLNDLTFLKEQLIDLNHVIQEDESLPIDHLDLSLP